MQDPAARLDSLPKIIRQIPRACFERSAARSTWYLARDFALGAGLVWAIIAAPHWSLAPVLSVLLGCVLTGLFVVGHDAGHRSFCRSERWNDAVGHLAMAPLLWPFHVWRLSHDVHHRWTHHAAKEIAWRPLTVAEFTALSPVKRHVYRLTRSSGFFLASMLFQYFFVKDAVTGAFFEAKDAAKLRFSVRLTAACGVALLTLAWLAGGAYAVVYLLVLPQLVFHFWLSVFTLLHHTSPANRLLPEGQWSPEEAQLTLSVQVFYPRLVDWLTHDIAWHVPHHVCVGVPHYHLREAHQALKRAYPALVQEERFRWRYLKDVLDQCHLIETQQPGGLAWQAADPRWTPAVAPPLTGT